MSKKKDLDSELNLIAFISLLSVLICSLLLTSIWVQIGSMNVKQAVGGQTKTDNKKIPAVWAKIMADGSVFMQLQDAPRSARKLVKKSIKGIDGGLDITGVEEHIKKLKIKIPDLRTALIQPRADAVYENIILLMDYFKKEGMIDLGVSPL